MNRFLRCGCGCGCLVAFLVAACDGRRDDAPAAANTREPAAATPPAKAPTRAALGQELATLMESFGTTVQSVTDLSTWVPAKAELARIEARITAITADLQTLPLPSPAETQVAIQAMKRNEDQLGEVLGDKDAFMRRLPRDVARELGEAAGTFSSKMGLAQQALYGNTGR